MVGTRLKLCEAVDKQTSVDLRLVLTVHPSPNKLKKLIKYIYMQTYDKVVFIYNRIVQLAHISVNWNIWALAFMTMVVFVP